MTSFGRAWLANFGQGWTSEARRRDEATVFLLIALQLYILRFRYLLFATLCYEIIL